MTVEPRNRRSTSLLSPFKLNSFTFVEVPNTESVIDVNTHGFNPEVYDADASAVPIVSSWPRTDIFHVAICPALQSSSNCEIFTPW